MDLRNLRKFFLNELDVGTLVQEIEEEVAVYGKAASITGASAPVIGTHANFTYVIERNDVRKLCEGFLSNSLTELQLNYIANLIELSDAFRIEDELVEDYLFDLSSPEVNGPISEDSVKKIVQNLT